MATQTATPSLLSVASPIARPQHPSNPVPPQSHLDAIFSPPTDSPTAAIPSLPTAATFHNGNKPPSRPSSARPPLLRARTDITLASVATDDSRTRAHSTDSKRSEEGWTMRHGFSTQYGPEQLRHLTSTFYLYFNDKRHETAGKPRHDSSVASLEDWRMRDRLKTVSAILAVCLNLGVDPPDVIRTKPCAKIECGIDPEAPIPPGQGRDTPMDLIVKALQARYEQLSMRTRYKALADPTVDETKKFCATLRRSAKEERMLFHYNGHGVPKPTASGEIWVFNKGYTQYIPISLYDLQSWIGAPSLFVYDCSEAGLIIENFGKFVEKHEAENADILRNDPDAQVMNYSDCIHLAACRRGETLPTNPKLPADLFTSCLTSPIEIAVRFFIMQNPLPNNLRPDDAKRIPGRPQERRTPIGELNWIFTAITDTIAWNTLPKSVFKKLFRQDLMVAALFRDFLLAQRIMRVYGCHPQSYPEIPSCHDNPLWRSWDLAIEMVLAQLPNLIRAERGEIEYEYKHSDFFAEQLTAFEVYLRSGALEQKIPEQLPIVLQVLLSQVHRLRALILLSKFLDLGPWAVKLALGIGIFPYVLKLLQSQAIELKPVMVFIWTRILAVDETCQTDLLKDNGYQYFASILSPTSGMPIKDVSEHRAMCAFIIAMFCKNYRQGQMVAHSAELVDSCLQQVTWPHTEHPLLRQWCCLCLSMLWKNFPEAKWSGIRSGAHHILCSIAKDDVPEVRAAMLHALANFIGIPDMTEQIMEVEEGIAAAVLHMSNDGSSIVRKELAIFYSAFVKRYSHKLLVCAYEQMLEEKEAGSGRESTWSAATSLNSSLDPGSDTGPVSSDTIFPSVWKQILILSVDPDLEVSRDASILVDYIIDALMQSPLGAHAQPLMEQYLRSSYVNIPVNGDVVETVLPSVNGPPSPSRMNNPKIDGYFAAGLRRTASVAASLKHYFGGSAVNLVDLPNGQMSRPPSIRSANPEGRSQHNRSRTSMDLPRPLDDGGHLSPNQYNQVEVPSAKLVKDRTAEEKKNLPFESRFLEWSVEYFREPQMRQNEADEPGSQDYNFRLWRRTRNEMVLEETQKLKEQAGKNPWSKNYGAFDNATQPMRMTFHQYDDHLAVSDQRDTIRIWDWRKQKSLAWFSNGNPVRSQIMGTRFINEDDQAILMSGSSDGVIRLFRDYDSQENVHLVSSFRALTNFIPSTYSAGLAFEWLQGRGWVVAAGDTKVIRQWDAMTEKIRKDIPARSGSCVTSLTSDQVEGNLLVAGFGDGAVRIYDDRMEPGKERVQQWKEHGQWITSVHMQRGGQRELVSGCRNGEVKLWDLRAGKSLRTIKATRTSNLRSLSVHEHAPVFAAGSERHNIKVYNMNGSFLSSFEPYAGYFQANRSSPIAGTAFHPHRMILACSAIGNSHVNLFACDTVP